MRRNQKGASIILVVGGLFLVILVASAASYYFLKSAGKMPAISTPETTTSGISNADDAKTLEGEIDGTTIDSIDTDLNNLDASASSL